MKRLDSTRAIFMAKMRTTTDLLYKSEKQIAQDRGTLEALRGVLLDAKTESALIRLHESLSKAANDMGYPTPQSHERSIMLEKIQIYGRQLSFLKYAATQNACIQLCTILEDLVKRILLKYYEEDIRRLKSSKQSMKDEQLIDVLLIGESIHRTLADKVVEGKMYKTLDWLTALRDIGMDAHLSAEVSELFLIRNCLVHNDRKVSADLYRHMPSKYRFRGRIKLSTNDYDYFRDHVHKFSVFIMAEYSRLFPTNTGTWLIR